ncbi:MAG: MBL fold metallo-hydrolase [Lachnospiraceae bacterium]|nr:MBL fold metallo-hydrolase [Lachnospiraceae bacterium]
MDISNISVNTQSSVRIDSSKIIYVDPLDIGQEVHDADYIFITHDHYDHFSLEDINKVLKQETQFVVPLKMDIRVRKNTPVGRNLAVVAGKSYETEDFTFETVPAYNLIKPFHKKSAGWVGYILNIDDTRIYIAGDTDATKEAQNVKCDIAMVPIGGTYTMNHKEAAALINKIKPKYVIPTHYGSLVGDKLDGERFKQLVDEKIEVVLKL